MDAGVDDHSVTEHDLQDIIEASLTNDEIETWLREDFDLGPDAFVFQPFEQAGVELGECHYMGSVEPGNILRCLRIS